MTLSPQIRAWHLTSGFLVDRGSRTSMNHPLTGAPPQGFWRELREYVQLDAQGKVTNEFEVSTWCVDDESSVSAYAVIAGELRERTLRTFYSDSRPDLETETATLTGLREVEDPKTLAFLEKALATEKQRADDHAARLRQEGEARVAAIPGATDDPGLGAAYLRAQEVLRDRVRSYEEPLYIELLRTLGLFGRVAGPCVDAYVAACRYAAFDHTIDRDQRRPKMSADPKGSASDFRRLKEALEPLQRRLLEEAEGQDRADAPQNAAAYRKAAGLVVRSEALIDQGLAGK